MANESLFRLVLKRPPVSQNEETPSIPLAQNSNFQVSLNQAQQSENRRDTMKSIARNFVKDPLFVGNPKDLALYGKLKKLKKGLNELERDKEVTKAEMIKIIEDAFGTKPDDLVRNKILDAPMASLRDSIIAIKLLPEEHHRPIEDLTNYLRDLEVIMKFLAGKDFPGDGKSLARLRRRSLMLPSETNLRSRLSTAEQQKKFEEQRKEDEAKKKIEAEAKIDQFRRLRAASEELTSLSAELLQNTSQEEDPGFMVPPEVRPVQLFIKEMTEVRVRNLERASGESTPASELEESTPVIVKEWMIPSGIPAFKPLPFNGVSFRLKDTAESSLSSNTVEILKERKLSISEQALDQIVEVLHAESTELSRDLDAMLGQPVQRTFKRMGNSMVMITTPQASVWNNMVIGNTYTQIPSFPIDTRIPLSHGNVAPAGIADLLVVKQQLVRYEGADVAHIENVLKGERKEREHSRRRETEELTFREMEVTTTEERELESTNRFEMSRETSETIKEDASLKAGLTISGKYGPTVEFSASVEGSASRSKEEATKTAANFSQDVTERSATKVTERVLERSSLRVTNEVIEKNHHVLANDGGQEHISGVYQWVNKVYEAQMFNYGLRTMYDFMIPEPGAFLIAALQNVHANAVEIVKPVPFTLRPNQISETNFYSWLHEYGATDVQPPPEIYKTKSLDFHAGGGDATTDYTHSAQIGIDEGYKAVYGTVGSLRNIWEDKAVVDVVLGSRTHRFNSGNWMWSTSLNDERDSIPFALTTKYVGDVAVAVEVKCQRTERALLKWRHETHAKLMQAYKARLSEYEEKLAALEIQAGVAIRGKNPALNMVLMNDELKKNCISIMTEQHFDLFDSITIGSNGLPQIDLFENDAEGPYVRFFEQAFEWDQMTWVTYPYFWGRKNQWDERISYEDSDPIFNQFLKAGYCRVAVPARLGFEGAIDHFMTYGEIWNGGPLPPISNPLYLPIADEIAERLDRPGDEIPQGDPWLVRIPTTLVHLRPDDKLPEWKQDSEGNWVEA